MDLTPQTLWLSGGALGAVLLILYRVEVSIATLTALVKNHETVIGRLDHRVTKLEDKRP